MFQNIENNIVSLPILASPRVNVVLVLYLVVAPIVISSVMV